MERALIERLVAPLFVPGDRPDRVRKARARGAHVIIVDLEDAVPVPQKAEARRLAADVLTESVDGVTHLVRVNPVSEPELLRADLDALGEVLGSVDAVVLPKVVSADEIHTFDRLVTDAIGHTVPIVATIENAVGIQASWTIATASSSVHTLMFGVVDLSADLGITQSAEGTELLFARSTLVMACAAAQLAKPIDGPHLMIADPAGLGVSARHARSLGFGGKIAIHPDQLAPIRDAFAPTADEVAWARTVVDAYEQALREGIGAIRLADGTFVDVPVAERARGILRDSGGNGSSASLAAAQGGAS
jgi:citrate lyase subunit beta / citryl-CoA lyase